MGILHRIDFIKYNVDLSYMDVKADKTIDLESDHRSIHSDSSFRRRFQEL